MCEKKTITKASIGRWNRTFTLKTLSEQSLEQFLAQLTDRRSRVIMHDQRVRHFNPTGIFLFHPQGAPTPRLGTASARLLLIGRCHWRGRSLEDRTVCVGGRRRQWGIWHLQTTYKTKSAGMEIPYDNYRVAYWRHLKTARKERNQYAKPMRHVMNTGNNDEWDLQHGFPEFKYSKLPLLILSTYIISASTNRSRPWMVCQRPNLYYWMYWTSNSFEVLKQKCWFFFIRFCLLQPTNQTLLVIPQILLILTTKK